LEVIKRNILLMNCRISKIYTSNNEKSGIQSNFDYERSFFRDERPFGIKRGVNGRSSSFLAP